MTFINIFLVYIRSTQCQKGSSPPHHYCRTLQNSSAASYTTALCPKRAIRNLSHRGQVMCYVGPQHRQGGIRSRRSQASSTGRVFPEFPTVQLLQRILLIQYIVERKVWVMRRLAARIRKILLFAVIKAASPTYNIIPFMPEQQRLTDARLREKNVSGMLLCERD